ncbi:hypothetical protein [Brevibacillus composti]|uniref:hypothetical protein n=1 Tax=Brevibacillus composti TaxID=2796470 RepID=UPI001E33EB57|nr:hypothetical protein [Brevibacillus composti]
MYRDEQGILREADGAIAWGFIGQYREKNPALYEEFIYPTYEHGERVEYWGGKVAAWADENRMDIEDAAKVIAFVPEELRKEAIENAYLHVAVKAAQDGGDLPDMGAVFPLAVAGSIKRMGKATGKVTQTSEPNGGKSGLVQGAEGTGDIPKRTYEPSPKHDPKSGWGSPNPISDAETGQKLLDTAYSSSKNKQLYNIYEGKLIKFQPDGETGWHPYEVTNPAKEVPADVLRQLLKDGKITKVEYNKLLKNK